MIQKLLSRENLLSALKQVEGNKGSHGVDGMHVKSLRKHILQNWQQLRQEIEEGTYEPSPVRRVEIPNQFAPIEQFPQVLRTFDLPRMGTKCMDPLIES